MITATGASTTILPRIGPKPLATAGLLLAAGGMLLLTQVGVRSTYAADILPGLLRLSDFWIVNVCRGRTQKRAAACLGSRRLSYVPKPAGRPAMGVIAQRRPSRPHTRARL
jgi:hypothetical protein